MTLELARARRAQTALVLLETTDVPIIDVAFAAGFQSVRQFNATVREVFARTPTELRRRGGTRGASRALSLNRRWRVTGIPVLRYAVRAAFEKKEAMRWTISGLPGATST